MSTAAPHAGDSLGAANGMPARGDNRALARNEQSLLPARVISDCGGHFSGGSSGSMT
jgi:hypothetical protein